MSTFTAQELAVFYQKVADGGEIETCFGKPVSSIWHSTTCSPHIESYTSNWRIKPTKKVIDLSVLIESGIDCEFKYGGSLTPKAWFIDKLTEIHNEANTYKPSLQGYTTYCRPRMNHKHAWQGGACPLPEGFIVRLTKWSVHVPHISHIELTTKQWISSKANEHTTVQAFEVLGLADGYVMPWEQDDD